jgi:hypothetical protein
MEVIPAALEIDRCQIPTVMAGEGRPSTSFLAADRKEVDSMAKP